MSCWFKISLRILWILSIKIQILLALNERKYKTWTKDSNAHYYKNLITGIHKERAFDTLFIVQTCCYNYSRIQAIHELDMPAFVISRGHKIEYKKIYNSEIFVAIIIRDENVDELMISLAYTLNYMRQSRILMIAMELEYSEVLLTKIKRLCEQYNMANVLLHFSHSESKLDPWYYRVRPYPKFHIHKFHMDKSMSPYYPQYWLNMQNVTLLTLPDQIIQNSMVFKDTQGQWKFNGIAAKIVLLFAERFNATLKLPYDIKQDDKISQYAFPNLTQAGIIDVPMSFHVFREGEMPMRLVYPMTLGGYMLMIPSPQQMLVGEVFSHLVSSDVFVCIAVLTVLFSLIHSFIDYLVDGYVYATNILMSDKVLPGMLGQSFVEKVSPLVSLKIIYLLIFFLGLTLSTIFAANLKTLITSPPFYPRVQTFSDIGRSNIKILLDPTNFSNKSDEKLIQFKDNIYYAPNSTAYITVRNSLNPEYGYGIPAVMWYIFAMWQSVMGQKLFYITSDTKINDLLYNGLVLKENSMLKEPFDHLTHSVNAAGIPNIWYTSIVIDLIRNKYYITKAENAPFVKEKRVLTEDDLQWAWMLLVVGLIGGSAAFLIEIMYYKFHIKLLLNKI